MSLVIGKLALNGGASVAQWIQRPAHLNAPATLFGDTINNKIYFAGGTVSGANSPNIWEYNPLTNFLNTPSSDTYIFRGASVAAVGNLLYFGGGSAGSIGSETTNFAWHAYNTASLGSTPAALTAIPAGAPTSGSAIGYGGDVYLIKAIVTTLPFYRYNVAANTWTTLASLSFVGGTTINADLAASPTAIFAMVTGPNNIVGRFYRYDIAGNTWTLLTPPPGPVVSSTTTAVWAITYWNGKIWATSQPRAGADLGSTFLFRYDIATATWDSDPLRLAITGIETVATVNAPGSNGALRVLNGELWLVLGLKTGGPNGGQNDTPYRRTSGTSGGMN